ncbi:hypothetical protein llap_5231 [Limosa lapponica baueri]|uniref:Uncharacterized protein n=1 Tax=Limosa lapponica baueri TaxID=1758121 RepID=A0A2I0UEI2_LIMLA|nr:hypothetical protein llap_5231 [Limosa lapponica baueri]
MFLSLSSMLMDNFVLGLFRGPLSLAARKNWVLVPLNLPKDFISRQLLALCLDISEKAGWEIRRGKAQGEAKIIAQLRRLNFTVDAFDSRPYERTRGLDFLSFATGPSAHMCYGHAEPHLLLPQSLASPWALGPPPGWCCDECEGHDADVNEVKQQAGKQDQKRQPPGVEAIPARIATRLSRRMKKKQKPTP